MANTRISQQLASGYNPDGTPGTVTTGVPGPPGPPPSSADLLAAVSAYLETNPVAGSAAGFTQQSTGVVANHAEQLRVGVGVDGSGSYVSIGTYGSTVDGYVRVDGTTANADLHLNAKGSGRIWVNAPLTTADQQVTIDSQLVVTNFATVASLVIAEGGTIAFTDTIDSRLQVASAGIGYNSFDSQDGQGFFLTNSYVSLAPWGGQGNPAGVSVLNPLVFGGYNAIKASAFTVASDRRWKDDIVELSDALEEVRTTPAYSYVMNGERRRGLIADEVSAELVRTDDQGYQMLESYDLVATLWAAVRELDNKIKGMEKPCRCPQTR